LRRLRDPGLPAVARRGLRALRPDRLRRPRRPLRALRRGRQAPRHHHHGTGPCAAAQGSPGPGPPGPGLRRPLQGRRGPDDGRGSRPRRGDHQPMSYAVDDVRTTEAPAQTTMDRLRETVSLFMKRLQVPPEQVMDLVTQLSIMFETGLNLSAALEVLEK